MGSETPAQETNLDVYNAEVQLSSVQRNGKSAQPKNMVGWVEVLGDLPKPKFKLTEGEAPLQDGSPARGTRRQVSKTARHGDGMT